MKTIILTEELAKECSYKNLRGLKMAISRKHGKGTYNTKTGEIDIIKLVTVIAKRADAKTIEKLICSVDRENENVDEHDNTEKIYNKAKKIIEEIEIRQGEYYYNNYSADAISSILVEMYNAKEITYAELRNVAKKYKLDLEITYSENVEKWKEHTAQHIYTNYSHYIENNKEYEDVYSITNPNLSYEQEVECEWAYEQYADDIKERDRIIAEAKENVLEDGKLAFTMGYDDCSSYLCIYQDKKLIGHYGFEDYNKYTENDWKDLEQKILKLFELENIDSTYIELLYKFKEIQDKQYADWQKECFESKKKKADYCFAKGEETFIFVQQYDNKGYTMYCYQAIKEINSHTFENKFGTLAFVTELKKIKEHEDNKKYGEHFKWAITQMQNVAYATAEEEQEKYEKHKESWEDYTRYTYSSPSNNSLNAEEKKIFKKVYKIAAMKMHPDMNNGSTEDMQILNGLKDKLLA